MLMYCDHGLRTMKAHKLCVMQFFTGSKICKVFFLKKVHANCCIEKVQQYFNVDATKVPSHFRKELLDEREIQKVYMKHTTMLQNFLILSVPGEKGEFEEPPEYLRVKKASLPSYVFYRCMIFERITHFLSLGKICMKSMTSIRDQS